MLPPYLYKFESFSTQSLLNLKKQVLYFGSPLHFNDPYDSAIKAPIRKPTDSDVEVIRQHYLNKERIPSEGKAQLAQESAQNLRESFMRGGALALNDIVADFLKSRGVTCFSESNSDLLMWSHYGGKYRGFCLEFSTDSHVFEKVMKVDYVDAPPLIDLVPLLTGTSTDFVQKLFCTKSSAWNYEREWRAIHKDAGVQYGYPSECLTGVYFGPDIDQQSLEIICLILRGQNESVKFWRGTRSTTEFKVTFEQFSYTTFLDAKSQGLR